MRRFFVHRPRLQPSLSGFAAALAFLASVDVLPARADDDIPGIELPKQEAPKTDSPKAKPAAAPKAPPVKMVWYKPAEATKILTDKGLTKVKVKSSATSVPWVLPDDDKVTEKLADFAKVAAANRAAAKIAKQTSRDIGGDRETLSKAQARYSELKLYSEKPDTIPPQIAGRFSSQQAMMQALQQEMNSQIEIINKLQPKLQGRFISDIPGALRTTITDWMLARNNVILAYNAAKADFEPLDKQYRALADDPQVRDALRSLGKKNRLASSGFEQVQTMMAEAEKIVDSGEVPFYRTGAVDTVGAILNDTTPVAILIQSTQPNAPSWAPADVLAKAGITVDPASPELSLQFSGDNKRTIKCRQVIVPKLRIGKYVLENLKFLAMPDDAKDLGLEISANELKDYDQTPDRDTWLYKFEKKAPMPEEPKADAPKPDESKPDTAKPDEK